jgi:hypothetical protein
MKSNAPVIRAARFSAPSRPARVNEFETSGHGI